MTKAERNARIDELFDRWLTELLTRLSEKDEEIRRLREALEQLLDDMGDTGHCVCEEAKQQAINALATPAESKEPG